MLLVEFEPMTAVFERAKVVHVLNRVPVIGNKAVYA
jgi:hypothetical protein